MRRRACSTTLSTARRERSRPCRTTTRAPASRPRGAGSRRTVYQLEHPWLLLVLPLPLLVWWLVPPYREETAALRLAFFADIARAAGLTPASGAVLPHTTLVQKLLAPICWTLVVVALARPQYVDP